MHYSNLKSKLLQSSHTWLVTGVAGFIGSNILETLLQLNQKVVGLDNFSTGNQRNLLEVEKSVSPKQWANFTFIEGDIRIAEDCSKACKNVDYVLHQAALGSVPRSIEDPVTTNDVNIGGFLNMLVASRDAKVKRFVYAASSSTYGDSTEMPKVEDKIGKPLSPYAITKYVNELYAEIFARTYGLQSVGLRYFNVFGPRQDPEGAYAAVIPKWTASILQEEVFQINGDGENSRDFCYVDNAVQINLLSAMTQNAEAINQVYNVAVGDQTSLNQLHQMIFSELQKHLSNLAEAKPNYRDFREGDVRHSLANISKAEKLLGYQPSHTLEKGLSAAMPWYISLFKNNN